MFFSPVGSVHHQAAMAAAAAVAAASASPVHPSVSGQQQQERRHDAGWEPGCQREPNFRSGAEEAYGQMFSLLPDGLGCLDTDPLSSFMHEDLPDAIGDTAGSFWDLMS
jgi:hypothetical protein